MARWLKALILAVTLLPACGGNGTPSGGDPAQGDTNMGGGDTLQGDPGSGDTSSGGGDTNGDPGANGDPNSGGDMLPNGDAASSGDPLPGGDDFMGDPVPPCVLPDTIATLATDEDGDDYGIDPMSICWDGTPAAPGTVINPLGTDCDDTDASINPDGTEIPGNSADEDCSGRAQDIDNDGNEAIADAGTDCDDMDGQWDTSLQGYVDADGDGFGGGVEITVCGEGPNLPPGIVHVGGDCDDSDPAAHPGAIELPELGSPVDNDCSGTAENTLAEIEGSGQTVIYVNNSIPGPGSGTAGDPFSALPDGLAAVDDGALVVLAAGIYGAGVTVTAGQRYAITGGYNATGWTRTEDQTLTTLDRTNTTSQRNSVIITDADLTLDNLTVDSPDAAATGIPQVNSINGQGAVRLLLHEVTVRAFAPGMSTNVPVIRGINVSGDSTDVRTTHVIDSAVLGAELTSSIPPADWYVSGMEVRDSNLFVLGSEVRGVRASIPANIAGNIFLRGITSGAGTLVVRDTEVSNIRVPARASGNATVDIRGINKDQGGPTEIDGAQIRELWFFGSDSTVTIAGIYLNRVRSYVLNSWVNINPTTMDFDQNWSQAGFRNIISSGLFYEAGQGRVEQSFIAGGKVRTSGAQTREALARGIYANGTSLVVHRNLVASGLTEASSGNIPTPSRAIANAIQLNNTASGGNPNYEITSNLIGSISAEGVLGNVNSTIRCILMDNGGNLYAGGNTMIQGSSLTVMGTAFAPTAQVLDGNAHVVGNIFVPPDAGPALAFSLQPAGPTRLAGNAFVGAYNDPGGVLVRALGTATNFTTLAEINDCMTWSMGEGCLAGSVGNVVSPTPFVSDGVLLMGDFHLAPLDPLIDTGLDPTLDALVAFPGHAGRVLFDYDGNPRPMGGGFDPGALEQ